MITNEKLKKAEAVHVRGDDSWFKFVPLSDYEELCKKVEKLELENKQLIEENKKHGATNIHLVKKIEELKEYKAMYEDLCR